MSLHIYYLRFEGQPIIRFPYQFPKMTHACRVAWVDQEGAEGELVGMAMSYESALRTAKNLITRHDERRDEETEYSPTCVISVGTEPEPGIKGIDRFLKLYWKPKGMAKKWDKHLHFKGRYVVLGETDDVYFVLLLDKEYKVSKKSLEIVVKDDKGRQIRGGPIFQRDF